MTRGIQHMGSKARGGLVAILLIAVGASACAPPQTASPDVPTTRPTLAVTPTTAVASRPTKVPPSATPVSTATPTPEPTSTPSPLPSFARPTETHLTPGPSPTPISTRGPVPTPTFGPDKWGRAIVVDQDTQTLVVYEGGYPLRVIPCSTGGPDTPTPPWTGVVGYYRPWFESFGTRVNDAWWLFREWDGNYYIHGLPFTEEDGVRIYQDREFLGQRPVSHGCIRISPEDAEWLTWWNPLGVPCTIKPMTRTNWN